MDRAGRTSIIMCSSLKNPVIKLSLYKERTLGLFGWTSDLRAIIGRTWNNKESTSVRTVPFILVEAGQWPQSDCVIVNMAGSSSDMTKDQMFLDLSLKTKMLLWSGIVLGSLSICILGYAFVRNWNRWKEGNLRRFQQSVLAATDDSISQIDMDEEAGDVPDGELCVICLMKRRQFAFIPCWHLVCCQGCAVTAERELVPKCPFCRIAIHILGRIYGS